MRFQRHLAYTCKGKKNYKNVVVLPNELVLRLGLIKGQELERELREGKLIFGVKRSDEL